MCLGPGIEQNGLYLNGGLREVPPTFFSLGFVNSFVNICLVKEVCLKIKPRKRRSLKKNNLFTSNVYASIYTSHPFHEKFLDPLLLYLLHLITGWSSKKKISSVGTIVYLVSMISHMGVNLLTNVFLLVFPQNLAFINHAHNADLPINKLKLPFITNSKEFPNFHVFISVRA